MTRRHYGLVVKIFAIGYKGRGFDSPLVHFHNTELAKSGTLRLTSASEQFKEEEKMAWLVVTKECIKSTLETMIYCTVIVSL